MKKFHNLTEAERDLWLEPGDPRIWLGLLRRWALHRFFAGSAPRPAAGVFRYCSVEEKQRRESPRGAQ